MERFDGKRRQIVFSNDDLSLVSPLSSLKNLKADQNTEFSDKVPMYVGGRTRSYGTYFLKHC